ncbi:MAG: hypothetical protein ABEJ93_04845 [Candidatus Nanohalobium sp.]
MGFFSSSSEDDKSVEDLDQEIREKDREIKKRKGERRLQDLKKSKKEKLKQKEKQLQKEKFKQTKAGKVINTLGQELGKLAEQTDNERAAELAEGAEKVDGDGKSDTKSALGIGLESQDKARDIEVEGDLEVEGDVVKKNSGEELGLFNEEDGNGGLF